jgi:hypothetical protein
MKAPIISIAGYDYVCRSLARATELAKLLGDLTPVEHQHSSDYRKSWYEERDEDYDGLRISLKVSEEVRKRPKRLGLPAPKRGAIRCDCGAGTVLPGEHCPSCNLSFAAILMLRDNTK